MRGTPRESFQRLIMPYGTFCKTRIAPTPSGYLHAGNVFSFLVTRALAERHGCTIMLRVDDMDAERTRNEYVADIFSLLNFLKFPLHEGPRSMHELKSSFSQQHRMPLYMQALDSLCADGMVYACECSRPRLGENRSGCYSDCFNKQLELNSKDVAWRLRTRRNVTLEFNTLSGKQNMQLPGSMSDFVVKRKDGRPAYQLCSVVDDVYYGVDLIVRGKDLLQSTLAQLELAHALRLDAFTRVTFVHHDLLIHSGGEKLSKSAGSQATSMLTEGFVYEGLLHSICNMLQVPFVNSHIELFDLVEKKKMLW